MKTTDLLILSWHQTYLSNNAGGYVRLREFIKRIPKGISYLLLDNKPTIYKNITNNDSKVIEYRTPNFLKHLFKKAFILWYFLEILCAGIIIYKTAKKLIKTEEIKVLYVPIGEFDHVYVPAIILKKQFPHLRLIIDILNYEIPEKNYLIFYKKLRNNGQNRFRALSIIINYVINRLIRVNSLKFTDYIFTVSPELVLKIKRDYKKDTIDFTPSGVNLPSPQVYNLNKKYLGVSIGRMNMEKGTVEIIDTWSKVVKKLPNVKVALAGVVNDSFLNFLKQKIKSLNLEKNVVIFGQVSEKQKNEILSQSELFLHLAKYEPLFPVIGILEGLSFGCPAIIYDMKVVSSQFNYLKKWQCLSIIENSNQQKVARRIVEYYYYSQKTKKLLFNEAKKFARLYDWNTIVKKELKIIEKLL